MTKELVVEKHDSSEAQDKEVIELEESDQEKPDRRKKTTLHKNLRSDLFSSPSPSFHLPTYDSEELNKEFNQFETNYEVHDALRLTRNQKLSLFLLLKKKGELERLES
jgi:hypothetical protein